MGIPSVDFYPSKKGGVIVVFNTCQYLNDTAFSYLVKYMLSYMKEEYFRSLDQSLGGVEMCEQYTGIAMRFLEPLPPSAKAEFLYILNEGMERLNNP